MLPFRKLLWWHWRRRRWRGVGGSEHKEGPRNDIIDLWISDNWAGSEGLGLINVKRVSSGKTEQHSSCDKYNYVPDEITKNIVLNCLICNDDDRNDCDIDDNDVDKSSLTIMMMMVLITLTVRCFTLQLSHQKTNQVFFCMFVVGANRLWHYIYTRYHMIWTWQYWRSWS